MKRSNARLVRLVFATFVILIFAALSYGQKGKGTVQGTVTDPSGASAPPAAVTLTNMATGISRSVQTDSAGLYRFEYVDVGTYILKVDAKGFATFEVNGLVVTVDQTVSQNARLELAKGTTTVTVESAGVQLVDTANAEVSGLVSRTAIANLPLEIRDATAFINLQPGATPDVFNGSTRGAAMNGMRGGMGNYEVDGADNNDAGQGGRSHNSIGTLPGGIVSVSPDAVQEFRVVTNNYSAEYGRMGGFVNDTVLKSGSNRIHGSAFEYNRNSATTANDFFSNKAGFHDQLVRNQFGGSLGGPIRKDKVFLYGALEWQRLRQTVPITVTSVAPQFISFVQTGQFASFVNQNLAEFGLSQPINCSNPSNYGCTLGPIFSQLNTQAPLPPATSLSSTSNVSSSPIFPGTTNSDGSITPVTYPVPETGQATYSARNTLNEFRGSIRYDQQIGTKNTISGHYLIDNYPAFFGGQGGDVNNPFYSQENPSRSQNAMGAYTRVITPSVLNEVKFSYLRNSADFPRQTPEVPSIYTADALSTGFGTSSSIPQKFTENTYEIQDSVAITHGRNSFKIGGEYFRRTNGSAFAADFFGLNQFWDTEDLLTDGAIGDLNGNGGFYLAEAAINPSSTTPAYPNPYRGYRANELSWYVLDNLKVGPRLTLNLGLRYDYFGVPHNYIPNTDSNLYFGSPIENQCIIRNATGAQVCFPTSGATNPVSTNPYYPVNPFTAQVFSAVFQIRNSELWNKDTNNFAPRFGLAWDVKGNGTTVIRAGGGVFYDRMWNNLFENIRFNPPLFAFSQVGELFNGATPGPISDPGFYSIPVNITNYAGAGAAPSPRQMNQNLVTAYAEQINFDVQHQFRSNWLLDVGYIATFGHKLTGVVDLNTFDGRRLIDPATGAPFYSTRRINPNIGSDNARGNYYNSNYNALQVRLTKRMSRGLQFDANYTWSHALDYVSDAFNNKAGGDYRPEDNYNRQLEYGNADFDIRNRFVADFVWQLPWAKQRKLLGGWSLNGILIWQSGSPFTVFDGAVDSNGDGHFNDRGTYIGGGNISKAINHNTSPANGYLNPAMFAATTAAAPNIPIDGLLARNALFGPGYINNDLSMQKNFKLNERFTLQVVVSAFNIWNHQSFLMVPLQGTQQGGDISNPLFGQAPQTVQPNNTGTGGRSFQFGARIDF